MKVFRFIRCHALVQKFEYLLDCDVRKLNLSNSESVIAQREEFIRNSEIDAGTRAIIQPNTSAFCRWFVELMNLPRVIIYLKKYSLAPRLQQRDRGRTISSKLWISRRAEFAVGELNHANVT